MHEWVDQAQCAGLPQDVFFSDDEGDQDSAIRICSKCPVKAECLAFSFETHETLTEGVFGGTTSKERTAYARTHGLQPGRIADRVLRPNSGRAWDLPNPVQGDQREYRRELVRDLRREQGI